MIVSSRQYGDAAATMGPAMSQGNVKLAITGLALPRTQESLSAGLQATQPGTEEVLPAIEEVLPEPDYSEPRQLELPAVELNFWDALSTPAKIGIGVGGVAVTLGLAFAVRR